ncbi:MAG: hypothetical protein R3C68_02955 [Myxococcota bacterium]
MDPYIYPDNVPTGRRLSLYGRDGPIGESNALTFEPVSKSLHNGELALRLFQNVASVEWALYSYLGFTKQPTFQLTPAALPTYARMAAYGWSVRTSILGLLANAEMSLYHILENENSSARSQWRGLIGLEREIFAKLTVGAQYYVEINAQGTDNLQPELSTAQHRVSLRLTYLARRDDLTLSLFGIYAPQAQDAHIRPRIAYRIADGLVTTLGANIMVGRDRQTFFGQFQDNTNVFIALRFSY